MQCSYLVETTPAITYCMDAFEELRTRCDYRKLICRCEHDAKTSAYHCIMDIISENNPEHFFVGTQDTDLRRKLQEVNGFLFLCYVLQSCLSL